MGKAFQLCGASVIVYRGGQILLQQRRDNGCFGYPGGRIELGEAAEDAARRELKEETGLTALNLQLFGVFSGSKLVHVYPDGNQAHIIDIVYLCTRFVGTLALQPKEVLALAWFAVDALPRNISPPVLPGLESFAQAWKEKKLSALASK